MNLRRLLLHGALVAAPSWSARAQTATTVPSPAPFQRTVYGSGATRIAVLLELNAPAFQRAGQAVLAGLRAAQGRDGQGIALEVFPLSEGLEELDAALTAIAQRRHVMAIGPLTRGGVDALTDRGTLPVVVLALNQPDSSRITPDNLIQFGLPIEGEARQLAQLAYEDCQQRSGEQRPMAALVLTNATPLARRGTAAFMDAWRELGGVLSRQPFDTGAQSAGELRSLLGTDAGAGAGAGGAAGATARATPGVRGADMVFAAIGADALRPLRAALPPELPVYGTSQLNAVMPGGTATGGELDGVRLLDMPWQLQPDNAAVMSYPRQNNLGHLDFQRLYALGIDAFRIARELVARSTRIELDGVTGRLRVDLTASRRIERVAVPAEIRKGVAVALERR